MNFSSFQGLFESFESDNSYYDETEDFAVACLNSLQIQDKKLHALTKDDQDPVLYQQYEDQVETQKLKCIFQIDQILLNENKEQNDGE